MGEPILEVERVGKQFTGVRAVDGVSFEVRRGEIFALLGPNGAGKTTTLRMLLGVIRPDEGEVRFRLGGDGPPAPGDLGYLPEDRGLYKDIPVIRTLTYFGMLNGLSRAGAAAAADAWLGRMGLADRRKDKLDALSKGNQQKVQFAASVLHRPKFAVLDEPFSGLDPVNQDFFIELVRSLRDDGTTILLSAHQMQLVERVADRILLVNRGRAVRFGTLRELRDGSGIGSRIGFRLAGPVTSLPDLENHPAVEAVSLPEPTYAEVIVRPGGSLSGLLAEAGRRLEIVEVRSQPPALHDIYVKAVRESGQEVDEAALAAGVGS